MTREAFERLPFREDVEGNPHEPMYRAKNDYELVFKPQYRRGQFIEWWAFGVEFREP